MKQVIAVFMLAVFPVATDAGEEDGSSSTPRATGAQKPVVSRTPGASGELTAEQVRHAIEGGIGYLLKDQNKDGSWGGPHEPSTTFGGGPGGYNQEDHRAWKVATTGLCAAALLEVGAAEAAVDRALGYLVANADVKRPSEWSTMNNWGYIYGLQGLATAYGHPRYVDSPLRAEIARAVPKYLHKLAQFQSISGGWGYLEFAVPRTRRPQWATSFMTAAAVVAMAEARQQGFELDQKVFDRAVRVINRCRLPNGGYSYGVDAIPKLRSEYINEIKGSLSRIQVCHAALLRAGQDVPLDDLTTGLGHFFRHHKFLDIALGRPIPHEAYYLNSGYFYLFGHYYAALVIESLPAEAQSAYWPSLQHEITKLQQKNGAIWDYDMHRYEKPYGVAFGLIALSRSLPHSTDSAGKPSRSGHGPDAPEIDHYGGVGE